MSENQFDKVEEVEAFDPSPDSSNNKKPEKNPWFAWTRDIIVCLILVLLFRANVAEANYIPSPSMEPNLKIGDRIIVDKLSVHWKKLNRGDMVVFHPPVDTNFHNSEDEYPRDKHMSSERWIKRVIGLPGETIEIKRGSGVYINGEKIDEPYLKDLVPYSYPVTKLEADDPSTPENEGEYFMLGDNRANSKDSHVWGPLPAKNIIGRAIFRYWPLSSFGTLYDE